MSFVVSQHSPSPAEIEQWRAEIATWPPAVRDVAVRFPPWARYRIASTGAHCEIVGVSEDAEGAVTLTVAVRREWNAHLARFNDPTWRGERVFGVSPDHLEAMQ
jgi:hypothetical protein